jgi:hypothetical protein
MDLRPNKILLAGNIIPEHVVWLNQLLRPLELFIFTGSFPGILFNRRARPFIYSASCTRKHSSVLQVIPTIKTIYYGNGQDPFSRCAGYYF